MQGPSPPLLSCFCRASSEYTGTGLYLRRQLNVTVYNLFNREFNLVTKSGSLVPETISMELEHGTDVASLMEELGFDCTYSVHHCKEILSYGGPLVESDIARILGTVARTAKGLEEVQNIHGPFYNLLCSGEPITSKLSNWHVDILLGAINQLVRHRLVFLVM